MTDFTVTITDTLSLAGIDAALASHNVSQPDNQIASDADYVQYVMASAAESYASHLLDSDGNPWPLDSDGNPITD